jgi:hypothetical protein
MISKIRAGVRQMLARRLGVPDILPALERLAANGFTPGLIFDVGAFRGDFALMALRIRPSARVACFEPPYGRRQIKKLRKRFPAIDLHETLVGWLGERGFVAYDICGMTRRPLDNALWQADMIFVRKDDPLRRDKGYFPGKSWIRS